MVEAEFPLLRFTSLFARLGDGGDELGAAAGFDDALRGLTGGIQFPIALRVSVGGVEDGVVEEGIAWHVFGALVYSGIGHRANALILHRPRRAAEASHFHLAIAPHRMPPNAGPFRGG